jgi:hypothetical protein
MVMATPEEEEPPKIPPRREGTPVQYTIAAYERFGGAYWCVQIPDLKERADDLYDEEVDDENILADTVQQVFNKWKDTGKTIPPPAFKGYDYFHGDSEVEYRTVTVFV